MLTIIDRDLGLMRIKKDLRKLAKVTITTGIHYSAGRNAKGKSDGLAVAEYAFQNEFGTDIIPARPFVSTAFDENIEKWQGKIQSNVLAVIEDQKSLVNAVGEVAYLTSGDTVKKLDEITTPPNSPYTIAKKGSSKPLIDTGKMRSSILPLIKWV